MSNIDEAILLFDRTGRLIYINKAGEEFLGKGQKELNGKPAEDVFPQIKDMGMLIRKTIEEGRLFNCREMGFDKGRAGNVDIHISPLYSDEEVSPWGIGGAILCLRENISITDREDYPFDSLLYLLGSISHEIKNPLSGIKGAAQLLKEKVSQGRDPEAMECVGLILKESDRLNAVLHSYLTMTRRPVFHQLNVHEVIEHSVRVMAAAMEDRGIRVHKTYDPSLPNISGDEGKLLQVFINLMKNAIEAMAQGERRDLTLSTRPSNEYMVIYEARDAGRKYAGKKKQRWAVIDIQDTGDGIPRDELNRIFLPFYTRKEGGSGLGLALSKKIVKDHGGIIKVRSKAGLGTTFSIYLPLSVTSSN
ncbi:MAG: ATP-binding protein [Thermodesulfovibrionales bacterium]